MSVQYTKSATGIVYQKRPGVPPVALPVRYHDAELVSFGDGETYFNLTNGEELVPPPDAPVALVTSAATQSSTPAQGFPSRSSAISSRSTAVADGRTIVPAEPTAKERSAIAHEGALAALQKLTTQRPAVNDKTVGQISTHTGASDKLNFGQGKAQKR